MKGIPARVTDFGLRGMLRVVLKPLISEIPLVGGVQAYFLKVKKYIPVYFDFLWIFPDVLIISGARDRLFTGRGGWSSGDSRPQQDCGEDYTWAGASQLVERIDNIKTTQVNNFIVLPNKFSMPLVDNVLKKTLKCPDSAGVLRVKLIRCCHPSLGNFPELCLTRAKDLVDKDGIGSGKSDPYAVLTVGATTYT